MKGIFIALHSKVSFIGLFKSLITNLGDAVYFHCSSNQTKAIQWCFLSFNYYWMKTLPILYDYDMKINSVDIGDAGMYTCQTENIIHRRIILTILRENIVGIFLLNYLIC